MKRLAPLALGLVLATGAFAQRGGMGGGMGRGGMGGGMGRGGFVGGGMGRGGFAHGGFAGHRGFAHGGIGPGGFVRGHVGFGAPFGFGFGFHNPLFVSRTFAHNAFFAPGFGFGFGFHRGFGFNRGFFDGGFGWGGGYPIYVGGAYAYDPFYDPYYSYPYAGQPNVTVINSPTEPVPPVVITQAYQPPVEPQPVHSSIREYGSSAAPATRETARDRDTTGSEIYLLAFKDGVIRASLAYWVEGRTLHYVGTDRKNYQVPLTSVNRDLSAQLNRERGVSFRLPEQ